MKDGKEGKYDKNGNGNNNNNKRIPNGDHEHEEIPRQSNSWYGKAWSILQSIPKKVLKASTLFYAGGNTAGYVYQLFLIVLSNPMERQLRDFSMALVGFMGIPTMESNIRSTYYYLMKYHHPELANDDAHIPYFLESKTKMNISNGSSALLKTVGTTISFLGMLDRWVPDRPERATWIVSALSAYANLWSTLATLSFSDKKSNAASDQKKSPTIVDTKSKMVVPQESESPHENNSKEEVSDDREEYKALPGRESKDVSNKTSGLEKIKKLNILICNIIATATSTFFYSEGINKFFVNLVDHIYDDSSKKTANIVLALSSLLSALSLLSNYRSNEASLRKIHGLPKEEKAANRWDIGSANFFGFAKALGAMTFISNTINDFAGDHLSPLEKDCIYGLLGLIFVFNFHATIASANRGKKGELPGELLGLNAMSVNRRVEEADYEDEESPELGFYIGVPNAVGTFGSLNADTSFVPVPSSSSGLKG